MSMRRIVGGLSSHKPLAANSVPPATRDDVQPVQQQKQQQAASEGLSVRKPLSAQNFAPMQQVAHVGLNVRKPISVAQPAPSGLHVRKPLEQQQQQMIQPQVNPRKPVRISQSIEPSINARKPLSINAPQQPPQQYQQQLPVDISMMNCILPTIKVRKAQQLPQQQPPPQLQQQQQLRPAKHSMMNKINPTIRARKAQQQPRQQQQVQQQYGDYGDYGNLNQEQELYDMQQYLFEQLQSSSPVPYYGGGGGVDPEEERKLRDLLNSGFINDAEYSERLQELQETQQLVAELEGCIQELSLDKFGELPFASDEAVYAADGEVLVLDDFVSSFLLPSHYGDGIKPEDFISSSIPCEVVGEAPRDTNKSTTRSARTKIQLGENRNVRVFISSTFRDMVEEREILLKYVFPRLRKFCSERGVFLTQVDLRWGITTEQSKAGDTINICLGEVDRCRPYFIGLLGERYGWAHVDDSYADELLRRTFDRGMSSFPWIANYRDRSITELEIRHAVLNDLSGRSKDHSLFYFRDPSFMPGDPQDLVFRDRLDALKREIRLCNSEVKDYRTPNEVGEMILQAMMRMLDKDFPLKEMPTPLQRDRMAHDAFAATRASVYIGRQYYFDEITKHLSDTNCKPFVIVGDSGSGKSALTCNWTLQYKSAQQHKLVVAHYIGCTSASTDLSNLLRRLMGEIKERYALDKEIPRDLPGLIEGLPEWLSEAGQRGGMVLVLDALNQLEDRGQGDVHDLNWLPREFPNGVQLIVSTLPGRCLNALVQRGWPQLRVEPLSPAERTTLVEEYMSQYGKSLTKSQLEKIVSAKQCQNPLFLRTLMEEIRVFGVFEQLDSRIEQYLTANTPPELFNLVFTRLENDFAPKDRNFGEAGLIGNIMGLLWVSRRGLTETELLEILDLPHSVWSPLHIAMDEYIISRSGVLTFFHDYMRQAVEARYVKNSNYANMYREKLIAYFSGKTGKEILPARKCEEVPYQLLRSSNWNALAECITDLPMFVLLFTDEYKFDLYRYWQESAKYVPQLESIILNKLDRKEKEERTTLPELSDLLGSVGKLLQELASYDTAEKLYQRALTISEQIHSDNPDHPDIAQKLDGLAYLYRMAGKYALAAPLYERAMDIRERVLGPENSEFASSVNSLAILYRQQGKYEKAEPLYMKALGIREKLFGNTHPDVAQSLNSLGCLTQDTGRYKESEDYFLRAVSMRETLCGPNHPDVAMSLNNLAGLYMDQSRYEDARPVYKRALEIYETVFGPIHPSVASTLNSMAGLAQEEGKYDEAAKLYKQTLAIKEKLLGSIHPELALTLNDYAVLYARQDRYSEAEPLYQRALAIRAQVLGTAHPDYAQSLNNLGSLYQDMGRYDEALGMFSEALVICETAFGDDHMDVAGSLTNIAGLYQFVNRHSEAIPLYTRALKIYEHRLGPNHADVAVTLNDLAVLHYHLQNYPEAEKLYKKALETYETVFGKVHPDVGQALSNLGEFYKAQGRIEEAAASFDRAASIYSQMFGSSHPKSVAARASHEALEGLY